MRMFSVTLKKAIFHLSPSCHHAFMFCPKTKKEHCFTLEKKKKCQCLRTKTKRKKQNIIIKLHMWITWFLFLLIKFDGTAIKTVTEIKFIAFNNKVNNGKRGAWTVYISLPSDCLYLSLSLYVNVSLSLFLFFSIFLSLILEQVRAHDRKEIQSIWFWARLIGSGVCFTLNKIKNYRLKQQKRICEAKWAITTQITTKSTAHTHTQITLSATPYTWL